jgi:hypothetical protein
MLKQFCLSCKFATTINYTLTKLCDKYKSVLFGRVKVQMEKLLQTRVMSYSLSLHHFQIAADSWDVILSVITSFPNCCRLVGCHTVCHYIIAKLLQTRRMSYCLSLHNCQIAAGSWDVILSVITELPNCSKLVGSHSYNYSIAKLLQVRGMSYCLSLQHCRTVADLWDLILIITALPNCYRLVGCHTVCHYSIT